MVDPLHKWLKIYRYIRQQNSFYSKLHIYINLTKCTASGINFSTKITSFHIFYTLVLVWIPPNFHELFHYKLATVVVCDFPCPYQMASALMLSSEFINFDFSWYIEMWFLYYHVFTHESLNVMWPEITWLSFTWYCRLSWTMHFCCVLKCHWFSKNTCSHTIIHSSKLLPGTVY